MNPVNLTVLSINFACRDAAPFSGCDNCVARFTHIANAISGNASAAQYAGLPDLETVDVILAQELSTPLATYADNLGRALVARGFVHSTGPPAPSVSDPQCADSPAPFGNLATRAAFSSLTGLASGGLVTFSKHPIRRVLKQNWCVTNLPAPSGYVAALLDVNGSSSAVVVNLHAFPEYDFGIDAVHLRTYQFSELSTLARKLASALEGIGAAFAIVLGGDFNEDAFRGQVQASAD